MHGHAVAEAREGGEEASMVTTGLDVFKPYKSAAHRWCIDAKASASNRLASAPTPGACGPVWPRPLGIRHSTAAAVGPPQTRAA